MLSSANISTFFQFSGVCLESAETAVTEKMRWAALHDLYARGCDCLRHKTRRRNNVELVCTHKSSERCLRRASRICLSVRGCNEHPFCRGCEGLESVGCRGVAVVAPNAPDTNDLARKLPGTILATWERSNQVKAAVSDLKASCSSAGLSNFAALTPKQFAFVRLADPRLLLDRAAELARHRLALRNRFARVEHHRMVYEAFQLDARRSLKGLFRVMGLEAELADEAMAASIKLTSERLDLVLLDFAKLNRTFAPWPCLHQQLVSPRPEPFEPCPLDQLPPRRRKTRVVAVNLNCDSSHANPLCLQAQGLLDSHLAPSSSGPKHIDICLLR